MKRFFCTVCKRVRRARSIPSNVSSPKATKPQDRIGQCERHTSELNDEIMQERTWKMEKGA